MEGVNLVAAHAMHSAGLRSVDVSPMAAAAARVHKDEMLSRLSEGSISPSDRERFSKPPPDQEMNRRLRTEFRKALLQRYRSVLGAWRELDPRNHGRLAFFDFCRACRHLGYDGEARLLWNALDCDGDGFISLWDVDMRLSAQLQGFTDALVTASGSAEAAWKQFFNSNGMGRSPESSFARSCAALGYEGDVKTVYEALNIDRVSTGVSFQDFQLLDRWFKATPGGGSVGRWEYHTLRPVLPINVPPTGVKAP
eukprot:TRINITY_DN114203_c0_g1_i1.p1 TRINITY_DN114203_c0_g1~~TRINITY_DN114203_c0_g1_i1.p1  ORF type:complete len:253 (+),score=50.94 TRINITY_DN114203_c0_g1_i1:94-852(+)